nr:zinc finger, CCHC-type [Tanacetum cinerariifolium]
MTDSRPVIKQYNKLFEAINDEMDSILGNNTWMLVDLPPGCKPLGCKWIFKIKLKDAIFDENRLSSVPRPSQGSLINRTEDIGGLVVPEEVTEEVVTQQPEPDLRKEAINDEMDSILGNNTWMLVDLPPGCKPLGCKWIFKIKLKTAFLNGELDEEVYMNQPQGFIMPDNKNKVDLTKEFLSYKFSIKDVGERDDVIHGIRIKHESNRISISQSGYIEKAVSQLEYSRVIGCLMYAITCTRPDIAFVVGKLSSSSMESEFMALAAAGKEAEWLRNLILEIPLWSKPIASIFICCNSAATLANAYIQMYNRKSRHLGVRHNMIRELIMKGVVSIEFVRSQRNLVDYLTKGLARDLVLKSAEWMGLKSNQVVGC